jgi:DNA repair protein RecN (Recombination protein N)
MLTFLKVKGFAIIDELEVEFGDGFNVITGETGAGKSIIVNALSTLMNTRVSPEMLRGSAEQADITAYFSWKEGEYLLRRVISASGRSRAYLDGDVTTLARMEEVGNTLVHIYGQNEFQYLLDKESYVKMVDALLGLDSEREHLAEEVETLRKLLSERDSKKREAEGKEKEMAYLEFQIDEIERANLREGEEEELRERLKVLRDADKIRKVLEAIEEGFYEADTSVLTVCRQMGAMLKPLGSIATMERLKKRIDSLGFDVEDIAGEVRALERELSFDAEELEKIEAKLSAIYDLKNKYGKSYGEIRRSEEQALERLQYLTHLAETIEALERRRELVEKEVARLAERLSDRRKAGVPSLEEAVTKELSLLSMDGAIFEISITDKEYVDENGGDDIELLISANPGEPLKPLRKVASGGELSRIMLAIKKVIGGDEGKTFVFDEVDAGIGGRVADMVGKRLKALADRYQVICITHLAQIAVYGDHHFVVEKRVDGGLTRTGIRQLDGKERIAELARMMGGPTITRKTLEQAEEMLRNA